MSQGHYDSCSIYYIETTAILSVGLLCLKRLKIKKFLRICCWYNPDTTTKNKYFLITNKIAGVVTLKDFYPNILLDPTCAWDGLLWSGCREWINITPNSYMIVKDGNWQVFSRFSPYFSFVNAKLLCHSWYLIFISGLHTHLGSWSLLFSVGNPLFLEIPI